MKKRLCSAVLALILCLALPCPALAAEEASPGSYEEAVAELRDSGQYAIEKFLDTGLCSILLCRRVGTPHSAYHSLTLVYKAGSPLGEGVTVDLPLQADNAFLGTTRAPSTLELNEDKSGLRYAYYAPEFGTDVYSVDLATGKVTTAHIPPTYEEIFEACTFGWNVEERLEAPGCTAVLMWSDLVGQPETEHVRDYALALISKENVELEQQFRRLVLPSTMEVDGQYPQYPTHRAPDALSLNEDGSVLTYVYRFGDTLTNAAGELLHGAGTYTYRVDTATGELKVEFEKSIGAERTTFVDVGPGDWFAPYVDVCVEAGLMKGVGGGRFDPQGTVTLAQAATLAARIHHIKNGGDGVLPHAPENYGTVTLAFENGVTLTVQSQDCGSTISPMSRGHFVVDLLEENWEAMAWLGVKQEAPATVWTVLPRPTGPLPCIATRQSGSDGDALVLYPSPGGTPEEQETVNNLVGGLFRVDRRPLPGDWFRDTVYYLETEGLTGPLVLRPYEPDKTASRGDFVEALHATAADLLTPKLNDISDFPDAEPEYDGKGLTDLVLDFYNAGVMTGNDELGTFDKELSLTRAEAAAICARILKPELRVKFQPFPVPEKYSYTLTYLMDDPMDGHTVTYPVLPIITNDGVNNGILTLDGELLPWPGDGDGPVGMLNGNGLYLSFWFTQPDGTKVEKGGLMDETGTFVVPLNDYCYRATSLNSGKYLSQTGLPENGVCTLWDGEGNATELGSMDWREAIEANGGYRASGWAPDIDRGRYCYVDDLGHRVSENFDWMSALTDSGRGFVGKDGKLYRIQFERR